RSWRCCFRCCRSHFPWPREGSAPPTADPARDVAHGSRGLSQDPFQQCARFLPRGLEDPGGETGRAADAAATAVVDLAASPAAKSDDFAAPEEDVAENLAPHGARETGAAGVPIDEGEHRHSVATHHRDVDVVFLVPHEGGED